MKNEKVKFFMLNGEKNYLALIFQVEVILKTKEIYDVIYVYKNESLFSLVTASRVNGWTNSANSFFIVFIIVRRRFL